MNRIREVHAYALRNGVEQTKFLITKLLEIPCIDYARAIFDRAINPELFLYNKLIQHYSSHGPCEQCLSLYSSLCRLGRLPNEYTFPFMLKACASLLSAGDGRNLHTHIVKLGFGSDVFVSTAMIDMYAKSGCLEDAHGVFDEMPERDVPSWNSLIGGYARLGRLSIAKELFDRMGYRRNVISWTSVVSGYAQNGQYHEAVDMYVKMVEEGLKPNHVTIASVLPACAHLGALDMGERIDVYARENDYFQNIFVSNALVEMYAKCGKIDSARRVFGEIAEKNVCSWNSMITGLAVHGRWREALTLFEDMQSEGFIPDDITFVGVLCACTHGGLVKQGRQYFNFMKSRFGISPKLEHYSCMVDLLGRAGLLREAYEMLMKMPMKPDSVVWGTLLGACSFHANVEIGEAAAEKLFELEPWNPGNYVIMSNIYAARGRWDGVARIRLRMKGRSLQKAAGYSLIEEDGILHKFTVEDNSHPYSYQIYRLLDELTSQMKLVGYVPTVEFETVDGISL
ncbi:pentatricopeptide repeat-containing protein At5g08510 [Nymphaea colorata]|uniref:DYW domain-containing protein n=1 Tax=Nymphaea colorata TaxID=210225 RepID=A0A5K0WYG0_9MAGN|nr:pentatricopeptide repeat-containing protein At5g08510 [Nymphaea colorata]